MSMLYNDEGADAQIVEDTVDQQMLSTRSYFSMYTEIFVYMKLCESSTCVRHRGCASLIMRSLSFLSTKLFSQKRLCQKMKRLRYKVHAPSTLSIASDHLWSFEGPHRAGFQLREMHRSGSKTWKTRCTK